MAEKATEENQEELVDETLDAEDLELADEDAELDPEADEELELSDEDLELSDEELEELDLDDAQLEEEDDKKNKKDKNDKDDESPEVNIGELLETIVSQALDMKTSDIHIEPRENDVVVRFRVDGLLREIMTIEKDLQQSLIFKIKVMAKLRTDEHFAPQDGRIRFILNGDVRLDTRVSILPTSDGEKTVFRLLSSKGKSFKLEDLGIRGEDKKKVNRAFQKPYGTILAVGPTGSGKTTTLYAIVKILNSSDVNITTIEDPVEYDIDGVNHVQVNTKANLTFATGLRSLLRQDPDIIMIGEIRDAETARIATNAALTGHLVLSSLHTNDAVTTIPRLIDMGIEPFLVASTINVIVAQRLTRKLCEDCKKSFLVTPKILKGLNAVRPDIAELIKEKEKLYKAVGCDKCNDTGYKGRIGIYEVLEVTKEIRETILSNSSSDQLQDVARELGLVLMLEDGVQKAREGTTTIEELIRVTAIKD